MALAGAGCGSARGDAKGAKAAADADADQRKPAAPEDQQGHGDGTPSGDADQAAVAEGSGTTPEPVEDEKARKARLQECGRLIRASNHEQQFLREASKRLASSEPASLEALADALEDSGRRIGSVGLHDAQLSRLRDEYRAMFVRQAGACRTAAQAIESKDKAKARAAQSAMADVASEETRIATALHARCKPN